jgi:hypothetical protein
MSLSAVLTREEIFKAFSTALETRTSLQLHNIFRGVPVKFPALVTSIDHDTAVLKVHCLQSAVISIEKRTFIKSETLPVFICACPKTVNFNKQEVVLTNFSLAGKAFLERTHLRVQPEQPIQVEILNGDGPITGTLVDISESRTGIFTFGIHISEQIAVEQNTRIGLDFSLPGIDPLIHLVGSITSVTHKKGARMTRIGIETSPDLVVETALMKYIDRRQVEILNELERIYQRTCPKNRSEFLP